MTRIYYSIDVPTRQAFKQGVRSSNRQSNNAYTRAEASCSEPGGFSSLSWGLILLGTTTRMNNRIYDRAITSLRGDDRPSTLTAVAEARSSIDMIGNRSIQLYRSYKAIRSGQLQKALHILGAEPKRNSDLYKDSTFATVRGQRYSSLWLEYWMGWAPAVSDINNAARVLSSPPPASQRIHSSARNFDSRRQIQGNPMNLKPGVGFTIQESHRSVTRGFYSKATVTNENLFLAQSMGLVNAPLTLWEVTPFSWLADWSLNVGKFLGSFTDTLGASFTKSGYGTMNEVRARLYGSTQIPGGGTRTTDISGSRVYRSRAPGGLVLPVLDIQIPRLSLSRAATAVSLLSGALDGHRDFVANNKRRLQVF